MKRPIAILIALAALFVGLLTWRVRAESKRAHAPSGGSATVEGIETIVGARTGGRVAEVLAREGDRVKQGQALVRIDCRDNDAALALASARALTAQAQIGVLEAQLGSAQDSAAVARAQAMAVRAQANVLSVDQAQTARDRARTEKLVGSGALPGTDLERADTRLKGLEEQLKVIAANGAAADLGARASSTSVKVVQANVAVARAQLEAAKAEVERAKIAVSECVVSAPTEGVITARLVEPGMVVGPGSRLLVSVAVDPAKVTFFLPNAELSRASIGAPATVRVDAYADRTFHGKVRRIAEEAEFTPRNVQTREDRDRLVYAVEIEVENHDGALRPGMPAEVSLDGTER